MKTKWTPGPWRLNTKGNISNCIQGYCGKKMFDGDDGFRTIAMFQACEPTGLAKAQDDNAEANARLIAAAPTMIELLTDIERHLSGGAALHPGSLIFAEDAAAIDVIRKALAKATGESCT